MIPLRSSEGVEKFPWSSLIIVLIWIGCDVVAYAMPGNFEDFLRRQAFSPAEGLTLKFGWLFHFNIWALLVNVIYAWVFLPRLIERRGVIYTAALGLAAVPLSFTLYAQLFPGSRGPLLLSDAVMGAWLGACLRRDIWSTVYTLVPGLGWLRFYDVPSYVLLFFWFFYLLLAHFFAPLSFATAPMPYFIPFVSLIFGFLVESVTEFIWRRFHAR